jgi:hypothetical protein
MLKKINVPLWSNVPFVIPAAIAISKGWIAYAILLLTATAVSIAYHASGEQMLSRTDRILATSVIGANLYIFYLSGFRQPYFGIALLFVFIAFYFFFKAKKDYTVNHGLWHLSSVVITMMTVLSY